MSLVTTAELERLAAELGIDVVGAAPAEPYEATERHIARAQGARPLRGHAIHDGQTRGLVPPGDAAPERAHRRLRRALLLRARRRRRDRARAGSRATPGSTRTRSCARSSRRSARRLGGDYRVLVDENHHVDREGAARAGVGFYGKNTMLITRRHGSWVVLGTLVTEAEIERLRAARARLRRRARSASTPARRARSTSRARSTRRAASRTGRRRPARSPRSTAARSETRCTAATSARTSARGTAGSRSAAQDEAPPAAAEPHVSLVEWLEAGDEELRERYDRLYFPRNDPRYLRRNALVAAGTRRRPGAAALRRGVRRRRRRRSCASTRSGRRTPGGAGMNGARAPQGAGWIAYARLIAVIFAADRGLPRHGRRARRVPERGLSLTASSPSAASSSSSSPRAGSEQRDEAASGLVAPRLRHGVSGPTRSSSRSRRERRRAGSSSSPSSRPRSATASRGGVRLPVANIPLLVAVEWWRATDFDPRLPAPHVTLTLGIQLIAGLVVGWLVSSSRGESTRRSGARGRGRSAPRPDRPPRRPARRREPLRPCARVLARLKEASQRSSASSRRRSPSTGWRSSSPTTARRADATAVSRPTRSFRLDAAPVDSRARGGGHARGRRMYREDLTDRPLRGGRAPRGSGCARAWPLRCRSARGAARRDLGLPREPDSFTRTRSTCSPCSAACSRPPWRTSAPSRPSAPPPRSCAACPPARRLRLARDPRAAGPDGFRRRLRRPCASAGASSRRSSASRSSR